MHLVVNTTLNEYLRKKMGNENNSLETKYKLYFFFLPFGAESFFTSGDIGGLLAEFHKKGDEIRLKEGIVYSFFGLAFYLILFIALLVWL